MDVTIQSLGLWLGADRVARDSARGVDGAGVGELLAHLRLQDRAHLPSQEAQIQAWGCLQLPRQMVDFISVSKLPG